MRHGDALSAVADPRRPLSSLGREQVAAMAQRAAARAVKVSAIYHSGILRAQQTAELMAQALTQGQAVRELSGLCPDDDPMIGKVALEAAANPILLISHLPYIGRLSGLLIAGDPERPAVQFAPATLACCTARLGLWELVWSMSPKPG